MSDVQHEAAPPQPDAGDRVSPGLKAARIGLTALALGLSLIVGFTVDGPTLWGLAPIAIYAILVLVGLDIMLASVAALLSGFLLLHSNPIDAAGMLGDALGSDIVEIGLIIMLGAGLGEVLTRTQGATFLVRMIVDRFGVDTAVRAQLSIMIASGVLVIALGTLIGAFAIAAPIVIPIAARLGFTRSSTALMMFIGGACGMFVAPFVGSMVAIREYSGISYPEYVLTAGGPLTIVCFAVGFVVIRWCQRHPVSSDDYYDEREIGEPDAVLPPSARRSTVAFLISFAVLVVYGVVTKAGTSFAVVALVLMAVVTGIAARMPINTVLKAIYEGCGRLVDMFLLFWMLAALLAVVEELKPYDVLLERFGTDLKALGVLGFLIVVALIGWLGISGASAAQVIVIDRVFGPTADALGVPVAAWAVVLLCSCQADTFGPFPGPNMISPMAFARSTALKRMIYCGWILLAASLAVYVIQLALLS
ncbi:Na+/H+ antiporter NhaC family protein [Prauserella cavernicola]|uniref:Permease n=1 Tax=Prauserella cavernicola TaxID=2800127 RepID=A0A934QUG8_9PSEU|nr:Na+/H+ antiporter NhaC family protein [Prauserella cavernicola]MBK1786526.1 permease [Prauserella cavernicola]